MMKKLAALVIAPVAVLGLAVSLTGLTSAIALTGSNSTGSTLGTVPQCAWHLDGVLDAVVLTHTGGAKYKGLDYLISGSGTSVDSYVAPVAALAKPGSPGADDCSWYTSQASAEVTISSGATPEFTSTSFAGDVSMNFSLNNADHKLTATVDPTCASPWTSPGTGDNDIYTGHVSGVATSITKLNTTTQSACSYTVGFAATVPAGKSPTNAGSDYVMTGPTLTTTLVTSTS
jgi:hypothetical protein